jgi:GT2 family glycosyltransferase
MGTNLGYAKANNFALQFTEGCKWIALLNPDTEPHATWLESLCKAAQKSPEVACFASKQLMSDRPDILDGAGDCYHVSGLPWRRGYGQPAAKLSDVGGEVFSACGAAALFSRDALIAAGGFDEDFFCYIEDVDLGFRLRLLGYRCQYVPSAVVHHVGSATTQSKSNFYVYYGQRNLVWAFLKNMPMPLLLLYLPQHVLLNLFAVARFVIRRQGSTVLRAKWDAIKGLPSLWKKRYRVQKRRAVSSLQLRKSMERGWPRI